MPTLKVLYFLGQQNLSEHLANNMIIYIIHKLVILLLLNHLSSMLDLGQLICSHLLNVYLIKKDVALFYLKFNKP